MPVSDDDINAAVAQNTQKRAGFDADLAEATRRPMPGQVEFSAGEEASQRLSRPAIPDAPPRSSMKDLQDDSYSRPALPAAPARRSLKDLGQ